VLRGKIRSGNITGSVQNFPALSMVCGEFEVFKSTESEADPFKYNPTPVLIDLRTHVLSGRPVQNLVRDSLHGAGVELTDADLDFLIGKGGFLILIDSLNELPDPADARLFHTFFNQDAGNFALVVSQVDLIRC
jgi:hypothetical protein